MPKPKQQPAHPLDRQSSKAPHLQVWVPKEEYAPKFTQTLRKISQNKQLQQSIQDLTRNHGIDFVSFSAKHVDEESPDPGIDILYIIRGKRAREHALDFERELLALVDINQDETREATVAELRAGRPHYRNLQRQLNASQELICDVGPSLYPEARYVR